MGFPKLSALQAFLLPLVFLHNTINSGAGQVFYLFIFLNPACILDEALRQNGVEG